jgi:hypothetical protein
VVPERCEDGEVPERAADQIQGGRSI